MMAPHCTTTPAHWNRVAEQWATAEERNPVLARHKRRTYTQLITEWTRDILPTRPLKTDLFAEAFNDEEFLSALPWAHKVVGIDISQVILRRVRNRPEIETLQGYVTCDVTKLPFRNNCFDLIISDSTLDHLSTKTDIRAALHELVRVTAIGGRFIITFDNPRSITYPPGWLVRMWMRLGLAPYYVGVTLSAAEAREELESMGMKVRQESAILHYPHPDGLVRLAESCIHKLCRGRLDGLLERLFTASERLGGTRVRYWTGRYFAFCALRESTV